jgi:energy-coupling factor transport system substrate-specific component
MQRQGRTFNTITLVMIPVAIAINIAVGQLIYTLKVPLYLDSIGTILVGVLAGPWAGALTGLLSNLIWGLTGLNVTYAPFAAVAAIIGMLAGLFSEAGWLRAWWKVLLAGLITGIVSAAVSAPIAAYVFGGVTGAGTDVVVAIFRNFGLGILPANFAQGVTSDPLDKMVSFLIVWLIVRALPMRFVARFPHAENVKPAESRPNEP